MIQDTLQIVHPRCLHPHPSNERIYGQESIADLREKIAASHWIKPLVVTPDNTIISGHRRWKVAIELDLEVPIEIHDYASEVDELEALLLENHTREKTWEQKAREGETWQKIETERARQRMSEAVSARNSGSENFRTLDSGRTVDKVANKVGFGSGRTYEKAAAVVATADKLKEQGQVEQAKNLLDTLNNKSVNLAHSRAMALKRSEEESQQPIPFLLPESMHLYCGDFYEEVQHIAPESIDLILTDPPYNVASDRTFSFNDRSNISQNFGEWDKVDHHEFIKLFAVWADAWMRILKPHGSGYVFTSDRYLSHLRDTLESAGFHVKATLYWHKTNPGFQVVHTNFKSSVEIILFFTKSQSGHVFNWQQNESEMQNFIEAPICQGNERLKDELGGTLHPTQKPMSVLTHLLKISSNPGDTVFDGFCGVGSVAAASMKLGRRFIGIEQDLTYFSAMERRLVG